MLDLAKFTTESGSQMVWSAYLISAFVICLSAFQLTRRWQADIRWLLLALLAAFLFMPASVPGREPMLAPAMIFVALSSVTGTPEVLAPILVRYSLAAVAIIVLVVIAAIWRRVRRHKA